MTRALVAIVCFSLAKSITLAPTNVAASEFDPQGFLDGPARTAVIHIRVDGKTRGGDPGTHAGTAFFISASAFALTAAHLFYLREDPTIPEHRLFASPDRDYIVGQIGSAGEPVRYFQLVKLDSSGLDLALLQLKDPANKVRYLNVCDRIPRVTEMLFAFGFEGGEGLHPGEGHLKGNLVGNLYPSTIEINPGMSGGPVIGSRDGSVVGMAVSGVRSPGFQRYNFLLPVNLFKNFAPDQLAVDCGADVVTEQESVYCSPARQCVDIDRTIDFSQSACGVDGKWRDITEIHDVVSVYPRNRAERGATYKAKAYRKNYLQQDVWVFDESNYGREVEPLSKPDRQKSEADELYYPITFDRADGKAHSRFRWINGNKPPEVGIGFTSLYRIMSVAVRIIPPPGVTRTDQHRFSGAPGTDRCDAQSMRCVDLRADDRVRLNWEWIGTQQPCEGAPIVKPAPVAQSSAPPADVVLRPKEDNR